MLHLLECTKQSNLGLLPPYDCFLQLVSCGTGGADHQVHQHHHISQWEEDTTCGAVKATIAN